MRPGTVLLASRPRIRAPSARSNGADHTHRVFARTIAPVGPVLVVLVAIALLAGLGTPPIDRLTGVTWQWTGSTPADGSAASTPPDPAAYTVAFATDRTLRATADCNAAEGTYRRIPPGRVGPLTGLLITLGPATQVACEPGSLSGAFLEDLGQAATYAVADDVLTITLADRRSMTFR